jgi:hypothetical protein
MGIELEVASQLCSSLIRLLQSCDAISNSNSMMFVFCFHSLLTIVLGIIELSWAAICFPSLIPLVAFILFTIYRLRASFARMIIFRESFTYTLPIICTTLFQVLAALRLDEFLWIPLWVTFFSFDQLIFVKGIFAPLLFLEIVALVVWSTRTFQRYCHYGALGNISRTLC